MIIQWKRLGFAALISTTCFGATLIWYKLTEKKDSSIRDEKPLAFVGKAQEDIHRRPAKRLLWQQVEQGEPLFNGEAIRTGSNSEVRILFADSDRYLDLESDSLIVLQKTNGDIALDLMEGSLYINAKDESPDKKGPGLILNSDKGKIDVSKANVSLSKSTNSNVQIQILEGSAKIRSNTGENKTLTPGAHGQLDPSGVNLNSSHISIISPKIDNPVYLDPENPKAIQFKWSGFPKDHNVSLWIGTSRKNLREISKTKKPGENFLEANVKLGKWFWKLVALDPKNSRVSTESSIYRLETLPRYLPTIIFPLADSKIIKDQSPLNIVFRWQGQEEVKKLTLEVFKDSEFKQKVINETFGHLQDSFKVSHLDIGEYYWRINVSYPEESQVYSGKIQKFSILKNEINPEPIKPLTIRFTNPEDQKIQYFINQPKLSLEWITDQPEKVSSWKLKLQDEENPSEKAILVPLSEPKSSTSLPKAGRYLASVEGLDKEGKIIGTSSIRKMEIAILPLLPSPKLNSSDGIINAKPDGKADVSWTLIDGTKEYQLLLNDSKGQSKTLIHKKNQIILENLMPGQYQIKVSAIDEHDRPGDYSSPVKIIVPEKNDLKAPSLKSKKVKSDND